MKKKNLKNLKLNKRSISNFDQSNLKGGTIITMFPCPSIHFCPTLTCTGGFVCGFIKGYTDSDKGNN